MATIKLPNSDQFDTMNGHLANIVGTATAAIGNRTYTENNYVTDSETVTASIDALDVAVGEVVNNVEADRGGWIVAGETWTYASANTFTVSGNVSTKYQKGDKIKLTQGTVEYFYILSAVYSSPNTTITVTGGSEYTIANAAITDPYHSRMATPYGFPDWFDYTPTASASGSMTYTSVSYNNAKFRIDGRMCTVIIGYANGTTGGAASTSLIFSLPVNAVNYYQQGIGWTYDGAERGGIATNGTSYTGVAVSKPDRSNWGLGAVRLASVQMTYPI